MNNNSAYSSFVTRLAGFMVLFITIFIQAIMSENSIKSPYFLISCLIMIALGIYMLCFGFRIQINSILWQIKYKKSISSNKIGVLKEQGCSKNATDFSESYWYRLLENGHNPNYISFEELNNDYVAIINPYGEIYCEEDITNLETFNKIREYVQNGGIFVNPGGVAFWFAWNKNRRRSTPTAREIYGYAGPIRSRQIQQQIVPITAELGPTVQIGNFSLTDTLTYRSFKLLTTVGDSQPRKVYQLQEDIDFCGDITRIGGSNDIIEFRAVREPLPKCFPMLRADILGVNNRKFTIYPMIAIPERRGLFIFAGMSFKFKDKKGKVNRNKKRIAEKQAKRVVLGMKHILENMILLDMEKSRR